MDASSAPERGPMRCQDETESPAHSPMASPRATTLRVERVTPAPSAPMFIPGRGVPVNGDVTMTYEEEASPPTSRPHVPQSAAEMNQSSILEKRHLLSNLSSKVSHVAQMVEELSSEVLAHDFSANFSDVTTALRTDLARFQQQLNMGARFYSFLMNTHLAFDSADSGYFGVLPLEIILHIFSFLCAKDLCTLSRVSKLWCTLAADPQLWKNLVEARWDTRLLENSKPDHKPWKWLYECKSHRFAEGEVKNGLGLCTLPHGNAYEGEWKENKREGWGISRMTNGRIFCGQWRDDKRNGYGIFTWPGGDVYQGNWRDSKRSGPGSYTWSDGRKYEGEWTDDKRHGFGVSTYPDGRKYIGEYSEGKRNGVGRCFYPDGAKYEGEYRQNKRHVRHDAGQGCFTWPDSDSYNGEWSKGKRSGNGSFRSADGKITVQQEWREGQWDPSNKGVSGVNPAPGTAPPQHPPPPDDDD